MHKCPVGGCNRQLDENGYPVDYCDFQQGRCPMQKVHYEPNAVIFYLLIFVLLFSVIWYNI